MATLRDVARLAGVSAMTVSRVANNSGDVKSETRARVESAIAQLGFVPNAVGRLLAQKRNRASSSLTSEISGFGSESYKQARSVTADELGLHASAGRRDPALQGPSSLLGDTAR